MMTLKEVKNALRDGTMTLDDVEDNYPEYLEFSLFADDATEEEYANLSYEELRDMMWANKLDWELLKKVNPEYYDDLRSEPVFDPENNPLLNIINEMLANA